MPDRPKILAFDTASAHCAVAILCGEEIFAQAEEPMAKGQAERLLVLCSELMQDVGIAYRELTALGVGIGPGNFTGVRISVSAGRGLALGLGIPAVGVSSLEAAQFGTQTPCACAVDARRDQVYVQIFDGVVDRAPVVVPSDALPDFEGPLLGAGGRTPAFAHAEAIARLASMRYATTIQRPAPLYLRPADAAPARDAPPLILP